MKSVVEPKRLSHVVTVAQAHNGDWISATPIAQIGTRLYDDELRILVAFRLGLVVCHPHRCRCGSSVLPDGLHPLSCRYSAGIFPRHATINDITKRVLDAAGFHSVLETVVQDRGDGRRPDGINVSPFRQGKTLVWVIILLFVDWCQCLGRATLMMFYYSRNMQRNATD